MLHRYNVFPAMEMKESLPPLNQICVWYTQTEEIPCANPFTMLADYCTCEYANTSSGFPNHVEHMNWGIPSSRETQYGNHRAISAQIGAYKGDSNSYTNIYANRMCRVQEVPNSLTSKIEKFTLKKSLLKNYKCKVEKRTNFRGSISTVYVCKYDNCNKEFTRTWSILDHVRMHEGEKPYQCPFCSRHYTQKGNLDKHMLLHQKPEVEARRSHQCLHCAKWYTEKYNLKTHIRKFHPEEYKKKYGVYKKRQS
ncbi:unnamed protein product [Moneuplotes crassus]|uniref:C2H2-type domain-containing protein n=1 Tax=Euplotes crassus TaxID=5936 RepID=A0AAD1XIS8_EUPCR|nr:unnamed protein product [Moneuplotes crassus]